ncbi:hypothetical protein KA089_00960 [Candidatus Woesebacteria bacterium]|nr:hypothetical protein [Candidatus Woesebacteria bacterium]
METPKFSELFRFFRIYCGFTTLAQFNKELKIYQFKLSESLLSHWQIGDRKPTNRTLILTIIKIFNNKNPIISEYFANQILISLNKRPLTLIEIGDIKKFAAEQNNTQIEVELLNFLSNFNINKRYNLKNRSKYRFNFIISSRNFNYLEEVANKNNISKANFVRQLIEEHRNLNK